jgi:hypothetical protein
MLIIPVYADGRRKTKNVGATRERRKESRKKRGKERKEKKLGKE